jgi:hypothetical protein
VTHLEATTVPVAPAASPGQRRVSDTLYVSTRKSCDGSSASHGPAVWVALPQLLRVMITSERIGTM